MNDAMQAAERAYQMTKDLADQICSKSSPVEAKLSIRILEQRCRTEIAFLRIATAFDDPKKCLQMDVQVLRDTLDYLILVEHGLNTFYDTVLKGATPDDN